MDPEPNQQVKPSDDMKQADEANGEGPGGQVNDTEGRYGDNESPV